jgi:Cdc6-like AAA superfamily ATPase
MPKVNPFQPNSPVTPGMFVGRVNELVALEKALVQTRGGSPKHFMLTGERGIGKTSLLNYIRWVAQGDITSLDDEAFHFLVIDIDVERGTTPSSLARKIQRAIDRKLADTEKARSFLKSTWNFFSRVEAFGVSVDQRPSAPSDEDLLDELAYSLAETVQRTCTVGLKEPVFSASYDGVLLCIDEADRAQKELGLGAMLKLLTERLHNRGCDRLLVGLAGLPELREVLRESHASALRIFDEVQLERLAPGDIQAVIDKCITTANKQNLEQTSITDEARQVIVAMSEGYPHFIQQFGYSAFDADSDHNIDATDAAKGAFGPRGALHLIGDRYYRDDFYNKIQKDSYRQVLRIMADKLDAWVSKDEIRAIFKGKDSTLSNALQALRDRRIILSKEGDRGIYRLQHKGFAWWIKLQRDSPSEELPFSEQSSPDADAEDENTHPAVE